MPEQHPLTTYIEKLLATDAKKKCPCPVRDCKWNGDCQTCVRVHRLFNEHVPHCMQLMLKDKIKALASVAELTVSAKVVTADEAWARLKDSLPPTPGENPMQNLIVTSNTQGRTKDND